MTSPGPKGVTTCCSSSTESPWHSFGSFLSCSDLDGSFLWFVFHWAITPIQAHVVKRPKVSKLDGMQQHSMATCAKKTRHWTNWLKAQVQALGKIERTSSWEVAPVKPRFQRKSHLKWMIWGYPYFRKPPYGDIVIIKNNLFLPTWLMIPEMGYFWGFMRILLWYQWFNGMKINQFGFGVDKMYR